MPYQLDYQMYAPWPDSPSGNYYWSNAWILNISNDGQATLAASRVADFMLPCMLDVAFAPRRQWKRAPGMGGVYRTQNLTGAHGTYPSGSAGYSLLWAVRIELYADGEPVGYKRWRMPVRIDEVAGGMVDPALITHLSDNFAPLIAFQVLAARDGRVIDDYEIKPDIRQWQLRTGGMRRRRPVLA